MITHCHDQVISALHLHMLRNLSYYIDLHSRHYISITILFIIDWVRMMAIIAFVVFGMLFYLSLEFLVLFCLAFL